MGNGKEALTFFNKSKVKKKVLAAIWKLVDTNDTGRLSRTKFYIMFHIVVRYRNNKSMELPTELPYFLQPEFVDKLGEEIVEEPVVVPAVEKNDAANDQEGWGFGNDAPGGFDANFDDAPAPQ